MALHRSIPNQRIAAAVAVIAATAAIVGGCSDDEVLTVTTEQQSTTAANPGWSVGPATPRRISMLDKTAAERGVEQLLTDSYGLPEVSAVRCPEAQVVVEGEAFECMLVAGGANQKVIVTFVDDEGTYEVSRPVPAGR